jgi:uncharacterized protein YdcH (DUF465 family)
LALRICKQNAAVIIRKQSSTTVFEIFEVHPSNESVMSIHGKLVRSYPGPAIEVPNTIAEDAGFIEEISSFLEQMDPKDLQDSRAGAVRADSGVNAERDSVNPHHISQLFAGILRGMGKAIEPRRVVKRIANEVLWDKTFEPWRRSPHWLIVRVAIQTSLSSVEDYKHFMLFFQTHLLRICLAEPSFSSELLFSMRVKTARRLYKIQDTVPQFVIAAVRLVADQTEVVLQSRWTEIHSDIPALNPLDLGTGNGEDTAHSLPKLRAYLSRTLQCPSSNQNQTSFVPPNFPRLCNIQDFKSFDNGLLSSAFTVHKHVTLFDFEASVHEYLTEWTDNNCHSESAYAVIASCIEQYTSAALSYYSDVADRSIMILTIMTLWVSLDRLVTRLYPLLLDYSPEISENIVEPLLLRSSENIEQANIIQTYLRSRHADAVAIRRSSFFLDQVTDESLSVRYFRQSSTLQKLKQEIEQDAEWKRERKLEEMRQKNREYAQLVERAERLNHEIFRPEHGRSRHSLECERCRLTCEARKMRIDVYEWPLPRDQLKAEAVVFELVCPHPIKAWRSTTYGILRDLGGSYPETVAQPYCTLASYDATAQWSTQPRGPTHRITIAPWDRSFNASKELPATDSIVCADNGLEFKLFDLNRKAWAAGVYSSISFANYVTFTLPNDSPYKHLTYALNQTGHTSNKVLADQSECPSTLSLHEHYAFGTLRSGPLLQWMNIARGLEEDVFTFSCEEIYLLHTQAAWQIGPLSQDSQLRDWHSDLTNPQYSRLLVKQSRRALNRFKSNWLEAISVRTLGRSIRIVVVLVVLIDCFSNACSTFAGINGR